MSITTDDVTTTTAVAIMETNNNNFVWERKQDVFFLGVQKVEDAFLPLLMKNQKHVWAGGLYKDFDRCKDALIVKYHETSGDLINGERLEIDLDLLVHHPKNAEIYYSDEYESLANLLDVPEPWIERLEVNSKGEIIHGNRRRHAARIVNQRAENRGEQKRFLVLPIEVTQLDTNIEELRRLLLHNQTREKKNSVRTLEGMILLEIEKQLANRRKAIAKTKDCTPEQKAFLEENKGVRSSQVVAKQVGYGSASTFENSVGVIQAIQEVRKEDPELADEWLKIHDTKSVKTASDILRVPPDIRKEVCKEINSKAQKRTNVANIAKDIQVAKAREEHSKLNGKKTSTLKESIVFQKKLGDKPNDNWYTPDWLIKLCLKVCDREQFDVDMFADSSNRIPAIDHINITMDAFHTDCKFNPEQQENIVFGNILYSDQAKCFSRISDQIASGSITEGYWIAESGVMHSKKCQQIFEKYGMITCLWRGTTDAPDSKGINKSRISFVPSDYLLAYLKYGKNVKDDEDWTLAIPDELTSADLDDLRSKSDNNRFNSVIIYYGKNKESFYDVFHDYGSISYSRRDLIQASSAGMNQPEWIEGVCLFMNKELAIAPNEQDLYDVFVDEEIIFDTAESEIFAKAFAIAYCMQNYFKPLPF